MHRLHLGHQLERSPIDLQLHLIDSAVVDNDFLGNRRVALGEGADRLGDGILDHRAHAQEEVLHFFDVVVEMTMHLFPPNQIGR